MSFTETTSQTIGFCHPEAATFYGVHGCAHNTITLELPMSAQLMFAVNFVIGMWIFAMVMAMRLRPAWPPSDIETALTELLDSEDEDEDTADTRSYMSAHSV